ncbi:MAG: VWA domain-containing protein [Christensenellaceae bacterium]|jgi:hypothetical protein|nr:VWA domain-containing protein [Christensenellaceae bacterium]
MNANDKEKRLTKFNGSSLPVSTAVDLVLIIDRSGSMNGNEKAINKYYFDMLKMAKSSGKKVSLVTILFDDNDSIQLACDGKKIENAEPLNYKAGGATALYDAYGVAIAYENQRKNDPQNPYPNADVLYVALTDGMENDSKKYDLEKLRNVIVDERKRSNDGNGRREFAQITEFGVDQEKMCEDFMLKNKNIQTFFRGDSGLRALFQTVLLALKDMLENKGITEKWKAWSDKLPIVGDMSLGQLKTVAQASEKILMDNGELLTQLESLAVEGLTDEFQNMYKDCYAKFKDVSNALAELNSEPELMEIMGLYIGKNIGILETSLNRAVKKTVGNLSGCLRTNLEGLRAVAENMGAKANEFYERLNAYKNDIRKMKAVPHICAAVKGNPVKDLSLDIGTNTIIAHTDMMFNDIIDPAFDSRTLLLKDNYKNRNVRAFHELGKFTAKPIDELLHNNPHYVKFYETYNYIKTKMPKPPVIEQATGK